MRASIGRLGAQIILRKRTPLKDGGGRADGGHGGRGSGGGVVGTMVPSCDGGDFAAGAYVTTNQ